MLASVRAIMATPDRPPARPLRKGSGRPSRLVIAPRSVRRLVGTPRPPPEIPEPNSYLSNGPALLNRTRGPRACSAVRRERRLAQYLSRISFGHLAADICKSVWRFSYSSRLRAPESCCNRTAAPWLLGRSGIPLCSAPPSPLTSQPDVPPAKCSDESRAASLHPLDFLPGPLRLPQCCTIPTLARRLPTNPELFVVSRMAHGRSSHIPVTFACTALFLVLWLSDGLRMTPWPLLAASWPTRSSK